MLGGEGWFLIFNFTGIYTTFFLLNKTVATIGALPANISWRKTDMKNPLHCLP